ncbi:hypothetical protein M422DRAFT_260532 [Sphaerobolus stellatus SS14]|uniref:Uncharacterized protein n=1 Tax=Sphaerobolus stellatus (strain SS14) TaxID=990650 RepID=A0A0C9U2B9_SPHS4|nr:hypothetical protein M422DRAFT_260532 [Sphaerobolus stellatus SS14]
MLSPSSLFSPSSAHSADIVPDSENHYEDIVRHEAFADGREIFKDSLAQGIWLDFRSGFMEQGTPFRWPLRENGRKFLPEEFDEAAALYDILLPCCLCATQESTPEGRAKHTLHFRICSTKGQNFGYVVAGCRSHQDGCGVWLRLDEFYYHPEINETSRLYERLPRRRAGIPYFNRYRAILKKTIPDDLSPENTDPALPSLTGPGTPAQNIGRVSFSPLDKPKLKAISSVKHSRCGDQDTPLTISDDDDFSSSAPSTPTRKGHHTSILRRDSPPHYISRVPANPARRAGSSTQVARRSRRHKPYEPSERYFGDTYGLHEPVDISLLGIRNIDIPLLTPLQREFYLDQLQNPGGVSHELMFMLIDRCNCGQYFLRDYLHRVHGPTCIHWVHLVSQAAPLRPLHADARRTIEDYHRRASSEAATASSLGRLIPGPSATMAPSSSTMVPFYASTMPSYTITGPSSTTIAGPSTTATMAAADPSTTTSTLSIRLAPSISQAIVPHVRSPAGNISLTQNADSTPIIIQSPIIPASTPSHTAIPTVQTPSLTSSSTRLPPVAPAVLPPSTPTNMVMTQEEMENFFAPYNSDNSA